MKAVETVDLLAASNDEPKKAEKSKKPEASSSQLKAQAPQASKPKPKTYTLEDRHEQQINGVAMGLSQKRGKMVGASEALRYILDHVDGKIST